LKSAFPCIGVSRGESRFITRPSCEEQHQSSSIKATTATTTTRMPLG
jgi:hypothetical protein